MAAATIRMADQPGDLGWIVLAHGEIYAGEYGYDSTFEALVAQIVADFATKHDPAREAAWIGTLDGRRVGCVLCVRADDTTAKLRVLLVDPAARGHGIGGRLVDECIAFARRAGYQRMTLWTNDILTSAARIYLSRGFVLVGEDAHPGFGTPVTGQTYDLALRAAPAEPTAPAASPLAPGEPAASRPAPAEPTVSPAAPGEPTASPPRPSSR